MLTIKQKQLLECIEWFIKENTYPPTVKELAKLLKSDNKAVFEKLMILEKEGYIKTTAGKSRSIVVLRGVENENTKKTIYNNKKSSN